MLDFGHSAIKLRGHRLRKAVPLTRLDRQADANGTLVLTRWNAREARQTALLAMRENSK